MAYTNNVPQGNQQIATTQPLIQANFGFIQTDAQVEHIFNGNAPFGAQTEGTHIRASMPNSSPEPAVLPSGTAGIYYVANSLPKFYNGSSNLVLSTSTGTVLTLTGGPITLNLSPTLLAAVPNNSAGSIYVIRTTSASTYFVGNYIAANGTAVPFVSNNAAVTVIASGLNLLGLSSVSSANYKWVITVNVP